MNFIANGLRVISFNEIGSQLHYALNTFTQICYSWNESCAVPVDNSVKYLIEREHCYQSCLHDPVSAANWTPATELKLLKMQDKTEEIWL